MVRSPGPLGWPPLGWGGRRAWTDAAARDGCAVDEGEDDEGEDEDEDDACRRRWVRLGGRSYAVAAGLSWRAAAEQDSWMGDLGSLVEIYRRLSSRTEICSRSFETAAGCARSDSRPRFPWGADNWFIRSVVQTKTAGCCHCSDNASICS